MRLIPVGAWLWRPLVSRRRCRCPRARRRRPPPISRRGSRSATSRFATSRPTSRRRIAASCCGRPPTERGKILLKKPESRPVHVRIARAQDLRVRRHCCSRPTTPRSAPARVSRCRRTTRRPRRCSSSRAAATSSRDFTASPATGAPAGEWHLGLVPKSKQADFETLTLFVDARTLALLGFVTTDEQGTNTIRFSNLKENTGLSDRAFEFTFPKGTEISR